MYDRHPHGMDIVERKEENKLREPQTKKLGGSLPVETTMMWLTTRQKEGGGSCKTVAAGDQTARQSMEEFKDAGEVT